MKDIIEELNLRKEKLSVLLDNKNSDSVDFKILDEYFEIVELIDAIKVFIKLDLYPKTLNEDEMNQMKSCVYADSILDPVVPFITAYETLKETDGKFLEKGLTYRYIGSKIKSDK